MSQVMPLGSRDADPPRGATTPASQAGIVRMITVVSLVRNLLPLLSFSAPPAVVAVVRFQLIQIRYGPRTRVCVEEHCLLLCRGKHRPRRQAGAVRVARPGEVHPICLHKIRKLCIPRLWRAAKDTRVGEHKGN